MAMTATGRGLGRTAWAAVATAFILVAGLVTAAPGHATSSVSQYEAEVVRLLNKARTDNGLPALSVSTALAGVARSWSGTMASTGDFKHNPSYSSQYPSGWQWAAENVAYGWTSGAQYPAADVHAMLMDSSGHRANILSSRATHIGVGVSFVTRGGKNYVYVTQNFGQYNAGVLSSSAPAAPTTVTPVTPFGQIIASPDMTGNGVGDVLAVDRRGRLHLYTGSGNGRVSMHRSYGTGWSTMSVYAPGDWNGDGRGDVVARDAKGDLWLYPGTGKGGLGSRTKIGRGWTNFRIVPAGDINGNGRADLLAIDGAGRLWLYPGNGKGGFGSRSQVGRGWNGFQLHAAGDMNRDGKADILGIDPNGRLFLYPGRGGGQFGSRIQVGRGWTGYTLISGANFNKDRYQDLLGRDSSGRLYFYAGRANGAFASKVQIGRGW